MRATKLCRYCLHHKLYWRVTGGGQTFHRGHAPSRHPFRTAPGHVPCGPASLMTYATKVRPSGLYPSSLLRPCGSLDDDISALRARWIRSLIWAWRCTLPGCFLYDKACWPREFTVAPQGHVWVSHIALPRRRPTATRMALSSRCRPHALMGSAWSQSPLWGAAAANNLALWYGSL